MIDENAFVNNNVNKAHLSGLKAAGNGMTKSPQKNTRTSRGSIGRASTPLESTTVVSKKRASEKSPAKSESKRLSLRTSPAPESKSASQANDAVKNRRETVDPADLDDILNDLDASTASRDSLLNSSVTSNKSRDSDKGSAPVRRSSRLSDMSNTSDISALENMSPLPPNRRLTVDAADVEALLNDSTTSSQMRMITTASPAGTAGKRMSGSSISTRDSSASDENMPYQLPDIDDDDNEEDKVAEVEPIPSPVDNEVQFNESGSAAAEDSFDDRRTTMDATDMQALLDEEDYTSNSRMSRPSIGVSRRTTVDAADMDAMLESLDEEGASDISCSPVREAVNITADSPLHAMLAEEEKRMSAPSPSAVAAVATAKLSFRVEPVASKARRASMAPTSTIARTIEHVVPRRMTADLADLKELAQELSKQHAHAVVAPASVAAPETASIETSYAGEENEESAMDQAEDGDSVMSLGALISRRGTLETSFNSSFAGDSRRGSRLSMLSVHGGIVTGATSPVLSPAHPAVVLKSGLKSCLSSKKSRPSVGARLSLGAKSVIFGSPKAAEFIRGAPTDALTPLARSEAKSLFSMVGSAPRVDEADAPEDEGTRENSAILEEWDRLTNTSNGEGSDEETDEFPLPPTPVLPGTPDTGSAKSKKSPRSSPRRRLSGRMPAIDLSPAMDLAQFSDDAGEGIPQDQEEMSEMELNSSRMSDGATGTVNLPVDFADLLAQNEAPTIEAFKGQTMYMSHGDAFIAQHRQSLNTTNLSIASEEDSRTMPLELDLQGVLRHVDYTDAGVNDASMHSTNSAQTSASEGSEHSLGGVLGLSTSVSAPAVAATDAMLMASPASLQGSSSPTPFMSNDRMSFRPGSIGNMSMRSTRFSLDTSPVEQMQESSPLASPSPADYSRHMSAEKTSPARIVETRQTYIAPTPTTVAAQVVPSSAGAAASSILSRLRNLNDGSRRNTLSNTAVGTPGASRFSIGAKRAALVTSATKAASATKGRDSLTAGMHTAAAMESLRYADPEVSIIHVHGAESNVNDNESDASADTVQEDDVQIMFDLHEVLTAAELGAIEGIADSSSGLLAALKQLQTRTSSKILNQISAAMLDNVSAAEKQAAEVPADIARLHAIWASAPKEAHAHVQALRQTPTTYSGSPGVFPTAAGNQLITIGKQCKSIVAKQWGNWEGELLNAGTAAVKGMFDETRSQKQQMLAEANALRQKIAALQAKQATFVSPQQDAMRASELQQRIQQAREQMEKSRFEAEALAEEYSQMLEKRKQAVVTLARDTSHKAVNEKQKEQRAAERQQELTEEYNGLAETQRLVGVLNRLSYYRTTAYKPNCIVVEVALTAKVRAHVSFTMATGPMGLEVSDVQVEVMQYGAVEAGDSESEMAHAFFRDHMSNNASGGPLSEAVLAQIDTPREIPVLLQRVSGQVISLRRALSALSAFSTDGYSWSIRSENIIVAFPGNKYTLTIPISQALTGGVMQLTHQALRSTATGETIAEYPMKAVVSSLRMRYGPTDRGHFQPFPARAVRKEVEAIVKHV